MAFETYESPLGEGEAFFNKGSLVNFYLLAPHKTENYSYSVGIQQLFMRAGANDKKNAAGLVATASRELADFLNRLSEFEIAALTELHKLGWPDDIPVEGSQLVFHAGYGLPDGTMRPPTEPARISFYAGGHLDFAISPDGVVSAVFDKAYLDRVLEAYAKKARISALPKLNHKTFGKIERDQFVSLKRKKFGNRFIGFDLYLPEECIDKLTLDMLDAFVGIRENLTETVPRLVDALAPLRDEWVENWLHPANLNASKPFEKAFPTARENGSITLEDFASALWLSSVCISPFGNGSAEKTPTASWDFHLLPRNHDNTIFVVRTDVDGNILEVCTET